jgi:hypothetical protein
MTSMTPWPDPQAMEKFWFGEASEGGFSQVEDPALDLSTLSPNPCLNDTTTGSFSQPEKPYI